MENNKSITVEIPNMETITRHRSFPIGLFAAAILFFFFNFCEMSCQGQRFAAVSGVALATGTTVDSPKMDNPFGFGEPKEDESKKMPANMWAVLAFLSAVTGLGIFLIRHKQADLVGAIAGGAGLISLVLLQVTLTNSVAAEGRGIIVLSFLFPYWASLMSLAGAGVLCLLRVMQHPQPMGQYQAPQAFNTAPAAIYTPTPPPPVQSYVAEQPTPPVPSYTVEPPAPPVVPFVEQTPPPPPVPVVPEPVVVPPAVQQYAINPPTQQQYIPTPQPAYAQVSNQNPWNNTQPRKSQSNWLIWLVAGAVALVVIATVLMEVKPAFIADLMEGDSDSTTVKTAKSTDGKVTTVPVSSTTDTETEKVLSIGYVRTLLGSDLRMREEPTETSNIVAGIPNHSPVIVLGYDDHFTTVNGERGKWCKIRFNGKVGWAWGKYIVNDQPK